MACFLRSFFLFLLIFSSSKHYMEDMSLFLWLFLLIFSAVLFDFLSYQTQSSKIITFFVNFFKRKKNPKKKKKKKKKRSTTVLLILKRKRKEISKNEAPFGRAFQTLIFSF